jgi:hypothetical protein
MVVRPGQNRMRQKVTVEQRFPNHQLRFPSRARVATEMGLEMAASISCEILAESPVTQSNSWEASLVRRSSWGDQLEE